MKKDNNKLQKSLAGKTTGSLINYVMGNNDTLPVVGEGCTILSWTDRHAYEVISVANNGKRVIIQQYLPERIDKYGMSDCQEYKYEKLDGHDKVIVWRYNSWYTEYNMIEFINEYYENYINNKLKEFYKSDDYKELYPNNQQFPILIAGKTKEVTKHSKINIIWGVKDEYYDYSF